MTLFLKLSGGPDENALVNLGDIVMELSNMSLGRRLATGYFAVAALILVVAAICGSAMHRLAASLDHLSSTSAARTMKAQQFVAEVDALAVQLRTIALLNDLKEVDRAVVEARATRQRLLTHQQGLSDSVRSSADEAAAQALRTLIDTVESETRATLVLFDEALTQGQAGAYSEVLATLTHKVRPAETRWRATVQTLLDALRQDDLALVERAMAEKRVTLSATALIVIVAVLSAVGLAWASARSVRGPVQQALAAAERIAQGDLSQNIDTGRDDELGRLLKALSNMQARLRLLVGEIGQSADSIRNASVEVAAGNSDLSQRTELASSNLQRTVACVVELTTEVAHNAQESQRARDVAESARGTAADSGAVVDAVVAVMGRIESSSRRIGDIVSTIDSLAFQTYILALNATVEAARAGEQGRGFAVVASEVRGLAQRCAAAASEIRGLIASSVASVDEGANLAARAGQTMQDVVISAHDVARRVADIGSAFGRQAEGVGEVNTVLHELDAMTQQNAALVEQSAAAAESLSAQACRLSQLVATFRLT